MIITKRVLSLDCPKKIHVMKSLLHILLIAMLFLASCETREVIYWEDLTEKQQFSFLNSKRVNADLKSLYDDISLASDNEWTFQLLDYLSSYQLGQSSKSSMQDAFNFELFSRILEYSDGALSEVMGEYTMNLVLGSPVYVLTYIKTHPQLCERFVYSIASEIYFSGDDLEEKCASLVESVKTEPDVTQFFIDSIRQTYDEIASSDIEVSCSLIESGDYLKADFEDARYEEMNLSINVSRGRKTKRYLFTKELFKDYLVEEDYPKTTFLHASKDTIINNVVCLEVMFCIPDTDLDQLFSLLIKPDDTTKIIEWKFDEDTTGFGMGNYIHPDLSLLVGSSSNN